MGKFNLHPTIFQLNSVQAFLEAFVVGEGDLLITNKHFYDDFFATAELACDVIHPSDYGQGEPTDTMVDAMAADLHRTYNRIIAVGGGSVLDVAKFLVLKDPAPVLDFYDGKRAPEKVSQLILIPTTCGTGSEVTNVAALALTSRHTKAGFGNDALFADAAVLIPQLLQSLPMGPFATSSIDALIHAVESALSPKATDVSCMFSYEAIRMILEGYVDIAANGPDARFKRMDSFLLAATYAGIAFGNAGCAAVHALSYPLGGVFHVPHGESNYAMFNGVMNAYLAESHDGEIATLAGVIAEYLHCPWADAFSELDKLLGTLIPKKRLREYGMSELQIETFADSVYNNQQRLLVNSFVPLSRSQIAAIYRALY
jgi:4-hydroxybutyrate dehydrogenase